MYLSGKYSQHSSIIWPVWLKGWLFVDKLSGCGFESRCCHLNFRYSACFKQGVPWHSRKLESEIHSDETLKSHDDNILNMMTAVLESLEFLKNFWDFLKCQERSFNFSLNSFNVPWILLLNVVLNILCWIVVPKFVWSIYINAVWLVSFMCTKNYFPFLMWINLNFYFVVEIQKNVTSKHPGSQNQGSRTGWSLRE